MWWMTFKNWLKKFFGKEPEQSDDELQRNNLDAQRYLDISHENITAIISNSLSILTFGDATLEITPNNEMLSDLLNREFVKAKRNVACGLGTGMIVSIPYCVEDRLERKVYVDTITKDRVLVTGVQGDDITKITVIADIFKKNKDTYVRMTDYEINGGSYIITNKCIKDGTELPLVAVDKWANIQPEIVIQGVNKLPVGIFKCPSSNRRPDDISGVPITFGSEATMEKIRKTLADIEVEFDRKGVRVFADRALLRPIYDENGNVVRQEFDDSLFIKMGSTDNFSTQVFDPAFRESSYYVKLQKHFETLEKEVGISKGILTELETSGATATEIKRSTYATFCLVDDIRKAYEKYFNDLAYGIGVLFNAYGLERYNENTKISIDWSYAMLEDSNESFNQMMQGHSIGAERIEDIRMFLHPDEDFDTAHKIVEELKEDTPSVEELLGANAEKGEGSIDKDENEE